MRKEIKLKSTQTEEEPVECETEDESPLIVPMRELGVGETAVKTTMKSMRKTFQRERSSLNEMFRDKDLPFIISRWFQMFFNLIFAFLIVYVFLQTFLAVKNDIVAETQKYYEELENEVNKCERSFTENKCHPEEGTVPALKDKCAKWRSCKERKPDKAVVAKISAKVIGEIFDNFWKPISLKALFMTVLTFLSVVWGTNNIFNSLKKHSK